MVTGTYVQRITRRWPRRSVGSLPGHSGDELPAVAQDHRHQETGGFTMTLAVFRCYVAPEQRAEHDRLYNQMHILIQQSPNLSLIHI